eukprot:TRINITY_DN3072_c0_g2_i1.p1 TRINITY_DN3072_c0_g2~~TRINITY_DN3072_c0_g2_i1.p1  ORF type:complete len:540 (-),score=57.20 TRINITY_DN3072_c0_g2_i1:88-1707(-)
MQLCFCSETIFFTIGVFLVLSHVFLHVRKHIQAVGWCAFSQQCSVLRQTLVSWTRSSIELLQLSCSCSSASRDELLSQKLAKRRLEAMSSVISTLAVMFSTVIMGISIRIAVGAGTVRSGPHLACLLVASLASTCASYVFELTSKLVELYYATMMITIAVFAWSSLADEFFVTFLTAYVIKLSLSIHFLNMRSVVLWNLVVLSVEVVHDAQHGIKDSERYVGLQLAAFTLVIIVVTAGFKRWAISAARQEIYISNLKVENSASSSLLDLVCDVVVQVDSQLTIKHESLALKAMLMKTGGATTKGVPFTSFIADDQERQLFTWQLLAPRTVSEGKVGTFRTTLSDSLRNRVSADIFFVAIEMDVDVVHYLLGVRELNERDVMGAPSFPLREDSQEDKKKVKRSSSKKGTPSNYERADFNEAAGPSPPVASDNLHFPQLLLTSTNAQYISMLHCLSSWNVNVDSTTCCSFHAYVLAAKMVTSEFRKAPCDARFPSLAREGTQCQMCGMIEAGEGNVSCGLCESSDVKPYRLKPESVPAIKL